jgi:cephalosporin-C deacetylase
MQLYDLPLEELHRYRPALTRRPDFDAFWRRAKRELTQVPATPQWRPTPYPADGVRLYALTFGGYGGTRIHAWYAEPARPARTPLPGLVVFHGYDWSFEGGVHDVVNWGLHGYATLAMLTRDQQQSGDEMASPHGHSAGWMTRGVLDPEAYYYRAVFMDAVRAVEVLAAHDGVDPNRIGVTGASQGGGLALAAAALGPTPAVAVAAYPYLCHFERAVDIAPEGPYLEIRSFLRRNAAPEIERQAMATLSYHDIMNLAPDVTCPTLVGIGLEDQITPPSTVFAAYNHLGGPKEIRVYRFFGHEDIPLFQTERLNTLRRYLVENPAAT